MICRELVELLDDYLGGELAAEARSRFEAHLVECRACLVYLASYRDTVRLLRETGRDLAADSPADVPPELTRAIHAARKRQR